MLTEVDSADHSGILISNSALRGWFRSSRSSKVPFTRYNLLSNRLYNRLHRVNRVSHSQLMCTATGQARGALSRGLSYVNLAGRQRWRVCSILCWRWFALIGRRWSMFDVNREEERSIAHKTFNITDQTSIQHLQTFSIKRQLAMYRYRLNDVPKRYFACTEVVLQKTHIPKLISCTEVVMYRNCPALCTETVISCTESDLTPSLYSFNQLYILLLKVE